jgi:hypothetical protein
MRSFVTGIKSRIFRKVGGSTNEYIRFKDAATFQHRFSRGWWTNHPYHMDQSGNGFELDWGNGDVFRCEWDASTNSFTEFGRNDYKWELSNDHDYEDLGSTDGSEDDW